MTGPLSDLRIVEFSGQGPGPFAGGLLADFGADVIRVDRPGEPLLSPKYDFYNRNKRSIALNLKSDAGREAALALVAAADVVIEGFRPGVMDRLGLGYDVCATVSRRIIFGSMTGWGPNGPMAMEAGHDINYLALTGALDAIGYPDRPPAPPLNLVADLGGGGMYLAFGILAAVHEARRSGQGQRVDAAMIDGVSHLMSAFSAFTQQGTWTDRRADNIVDGGSPDYGCYETADGKHVAVGAIEPQFYAALLEVLGLDAATLPDRADRANWPALKQLFAERFRQRTRAEWETAMAGRDACFSPVLSIAEAWEHPQMQAREVHAQFDGLVHPSPAPRLSRTPGSLRRATPEPGENSREIWTDWGLPQALWDRLGGGDSPAAGGAR
ncbi:CaiB/BaiF CoA transferase family protein [Paracoccus alkenifer]|uniref:Alpha-methylacyl-CoA racemase n=1 Tax=Paracoccus alkenifer TaxID=65735 RepID=A0A1H6NB37_9RHOB|nr:CaiB/BaiF CoA-transferase family protein [Paracoccus alkenifer]SEI12189.1 alpha-methylacyl-CoA racemase [Paracoccus alkenifer]